MKANRTGQYSEAWIEGGLRAAGCVFDRQVAVGQTIYGAEQHVDFLIHNLPDYPRGLVIESKWQMSNGSIDQKFPYVLANIERHSIPTIVIVHGGGCHEGAIAWLRDRCHPDHLVAVFRIEEFMSWLLRHANLA
jgi:PD-(D/E)XK nuclease superfamily domain